MTLTNNNLVGRVVEETSEGVIMECKPCLVGFIIRQFIKEDIHNMVVTYVPDTGLVQVRTEFVDS